MASLKFTGQLDTLSYLFYKCHLHFPKFETDCVCLKNKENRMHTLSFKLYKLYRQVTGPLCLWTNDIFKEHYVNSRSSQKINALN
jgi:hypothetical protein